MRRSPAALLVSALALAAVAPGCGDDDADRLAAGEAFSIEAALAELPSPEGHEGGDQIFVNVVDVDAVAVANGAERPPADASAGEVQEWWLAVSRPVAGGDPLPIPVPPIDVIGLGRVRPELIADELGFSPVAIRSVAQVAALPFTFALVQGDVDEETLRGADLEDLGDGTFSAGGGEDLASDAAGATDVRPTGVPLRLAADGDRIAASSSTEAIEGWRRGEQEALSDDDDLRRVARVLDGAGVSSAIVAAASFDAPVGPGRGADPLPIEAPFSAVGVGFATDDAGPLVTVAYVFADDGAAEAAADQVEAAYTDATSVVTGEPISERVEVEEVAADGAVVVARLRVADGVQPGVVISLLSQQDVPFTHR